ncbi:hypothetical protein [Peribacillus simplex]|uniref:hypothetical protein n=1 Tax=Peribacillus simplex TaxID=1478 RepID=UPI003CF00D79
MNRCLLHYQELNGSSFLYENTLVKSHPKINPPYSHFFSKGVGAEELAKIEQQVNAVEVVSEAGTETTGGFGAPVVSPTPSDNGSIGTFSQTGSWAYSKWASYTVTPSDKTATAVVTAAILSKIPYVGFAASGLAGVKLRHDKPESH